MTRIELAESMAEFLGMKKDKGDSPRWKYVRKDEAGRRLTSWWQWGEVIEHIFSPDGFFAVWDKLEELLKGTNLSFNHIPENGNVYCTIIKQYPHSKWENKTKDRYTAFYEAVYKMKNK